MNQNKEIDMCFAEMYTCPRCGTAISGEKKRYFVCSNCGRALCKEENLPEFSDNYCGNCGAKIISAREEALALTRKKD